MRRGFIDGEYQDGDLRGMVAVSGKRGSGKTTEMERLLGTCKGTRLFFDTLSKHHLRGYAVANQPWELKEFLRAGTRQIVYQPQHGDLLAHFEAANRIVAAVGSMVYAVDEIDAYTTANEVPPRLYTLINYGRHSHVAMVFTFRRPPQVARELTAACWEMRLFRTTENRDVRYFAEYIGEDAAARLRTLGPYQYLLWRDDGSEPATLCAGRMIASQEKTSQIT